MTTLRSVVIGAASIGWALPATIPLVPLILIAAALAVIVEASIW